MYRMHKGLCLTVNSRYLIPEGILSCLIYHNLETGFSEILCLHTLTTLWRINVKHAQRTERFPCDHWRDVRGRRTAVESIPAVGDGADILGDRSVSNRSGTRTPDIFSSLRWGGLFVRYTHACNQRLFPL